MLKFCSKNLNKHSLAGKILDKAQIIKNKSKVIKSIREYFYKTGSTEVFTNIMNDYPNLDSNIYPVEVEVFNEKSEKLTKYLHTSPELEMKKILSEIKSDIFQITKVFRNFEGSPKHKIEFTMLEWYRLNFDLFDLMDDTQNIFIESSIAVYKRPVIEYRGKIFDLRTSEKLTVDEAFYNFTEIYPENVEKMNEFLKQREKHFNYSDNWEELFFRIYAFYVEPNLGKDKLTFIYDYPPELSAMAKIINGKGKRFEAYLSGIELVNGYWELSNAEELRERLLKDVQVKQKEKKKNYKIDENFINAIKNLPNCSGASMGIDRWFMILFNQNNIHF
jgi:lysyl-tRNA synthetase class 2